MLPTPQVDEHSPKPDCTHRNFVWCREIHESFPPQTPQSSTSVFDPSISSHPTCYKNVWNFKSNIQSFVHYNWKQIITRGHWVAKKEGDSFLLYHLSQAEDPRLLETSIAESFSNNLVNNKHQMWKLQPHG